MPHRSSSDKANTYLVPGDQWHPLDGVPAPEYVPDEWQGFHVRLRLVEAFATLGAVAVKREGLSGTIESAWPAYRRTWEDLVGYADDDRWLATQQQANRRPRLTPSALEISQMESAIVWPARYVKSDRIRKVVNLCAQVQARGASINKVCKRMKMRPKSVRFDYHAGLDAIAAGLRVDAVPVY